MRNAAVARRLNHCVNVYSAFSTVRRQVGGATWSTAREAIQMRSGPFNLK